MIPQPTDILCDDFGEKKPINVIHHAYMLTADKKYCICLEMCIVYHFINPTPVTPLVSAIDSAMVRVAIGEPSFDVNIMTINEWLQHHFHPYEHAQMFTVESIKAPSLIQDEITEQMTAFGLSEYALYVMDFIEYFWKQSYVFRESRS